ncbi:MAG: hypothetical protein WDN30_09535 [Pararobbsia sp.]
MRRPQQVGRVRERREQMRRADRRLRCAGRLERGAHPCRLEQFPEPVGQAGLATQFMRQPVDRVEQAVPDGVDVEFIAAHDRQQIAFAEFEQLDQPVLDFDVAMGARFAKTGGAGEGLRAGGVEAAQERGKVAVGHGKGIKKRQSATRTGDGRPARSRCTGRQGRPPASRETVAYERSFQLSAWMMLPSLYDQVIFS